MTPCCDRIPDLRDALIRPLPRPLRHHRPRPTRTAPTGQGQRLDHQRADAAARRAQTTANEDIRRRRGSAQQIDSGRDLNR
jgi:hypothetical protein